MSYSANAKLHASNRDGLEPKRLVCGARAVVIGTVTLSRVWGNTTPELGLTGENKMARNSIYSRWNLAMIEPLLCKPCEGGRD